MTALIAPGSYSATCYGEGFGFYSYTTNTSTFSQVITADTATPTQTVTINKTLSAPTDWFGIDNHHHGMRADAFSPPEVVAKAEMTAGLEVLTLDDHEYVLDNCPDVRLVEEDERHRLHALRGGHRELGAFRCRPADDERLHALVGS